jgi:hypothetical protein
MKITELIKGNWYKVEGKNFTGFDYFLFDSYDSNRETAFFSAKVDGGEYSKKEDWWGIYECTFTPMTDEEKYQFLPQGSNLNNIWAEIIVDEEVDFIEGDIISVEGKSNLSLVSSCFQGNVIVKSRRSLIFDASLCKQVAHVNDFVKGEWYLDRNGNKCQFDQFITTQSGNLNFAFNNAIKSKPDGSVSGTYQAHNFIPVTMVSSTINLIVDGEYGVLESLRPNDTTVPRLANGLYDFSSANKTAGNGIYDQICAADIKPYEGTITTEHLRDAASYLQDSRNIAEYIALSKEWDSIRSDAIFGTKKKRGSEKIEIFL